MSVISHANQHSSITKYHKKVELKSGEKLKCQPGCLLTYSNISIKTHINPASNCWKMFKRYLLGAESLWVNTVTANDGGGWLMLEEELPGQVFSYKMDQDHPDLIMSGAVLLASSPNLTTDTQTGGVDGYLKGKGFATATLRLPESERDEGKEGIAYLRAQKGAIRQISISSEDGEITLDNDCLVARTEGVDIMIDKYGQSYATAIMSGEGYVAKAKGDGIIFTSSGKTVARSNILRKACAKVALVSTVAAGAIGYLTGWIDREQATKAVKAAFGFM